MKLLLGIENLHAFDQIEILNKELKAKEFLLANLSEADLPYQSEVILRTNSDGIKKETSNFTDDYIEASCLINNEIYLIKLQITKLQDSLLRESEMVLVENNDYSFRGKGLRLYLNY
jgi:hypothetical protein